MKRPTIQIDQEHTRKLLRGETIAIKIPSNTPVLQLRLYNHGEPTDSFAKILDVFFNGRPA